MLCRSCDSLSVASMANTSKKPAPRLGKLSVYLYIPNIIGGFIFSWSLISEKDVFLISRSRNLFFNWCNMLPVSWVWWFIYCMLWTLGYARVLLNCFAFAICFSDKRLFSVLYFVRWEPILEIHFGFIVAFDVVVLRV